MCVQSDLKITLQYAILQHTKTGAVCVCYFCLKREGLSTHSCIMTKLCCARLLLPHESKASAHTLTKQQTCVLQGSEVGAPEELPSMSGEQQRIFDQVM